MYCDCPILGRCCFCMPLRRGILTFAYINLVFSAFMVSLYSFIVHKEGSLFTIYHGASAYIPAEVCVAIYCVEMIFNAILIYGTHMKQMLYIRVYFYFAITTIIAAVLLQVIEISVTMAETSQASIFFEAIPIALASVCIQIYLIILTKSLLRKLDVSSGPNVYDNPLQRIVYEGRIENSDGVYAPTVFPVEV